MCTTQPPELRRPECAPVEIDKMIFNCVVKKKSRKQNTGQLRIYQPPSKHATRKTLVKTERPELFSYLLPPRSDAKRLPMNDFILVHSSYRLHIRKGGIRKLRYNIRRKSDFLHEGRSRI